MTTHFIAGQWEAGKGKPFTSLNPATQAVVWEGRAATQKEIAAAIFAARQAFPAWAALPWQKRLVYLEAFCQQIDAQRASLAETISQENGKPLWEALMEMGGLFNKLAISLEAYQVRTGELHTAKQHVHHYTRHKPHGVIAVYGPFNFPAHLPHGHIIPALLAGNTIIFKPSELTPLVAEKLMHCWAAADLPPGVINCVQGGVETGIDIANTDLINGLFFTGSYATGKQLHQQFAGRLDVILALELGGNNPLIVHEVENIPAAVYHTIQSAFITTGQRCTCARRLIIPEGAAGDSFLTALITATKTLRIGPYDQQPEPFMGPLISIKAAESLLKTEEQWQKDGGKSLLSLQALTPSGTFLTPGIIEMTQAKRNDTEAFGPLLQIIRCKNMDAAIAEANNTKFGLSAGLLSDNRDNYIRFLNQAHAGIVNWNQALTGASSHAPFGGIGYSGNHRPSAYYAADYSAYPVASMEEEKLTLPQHMSPGMTLHDKE